MYIDLFICLFNQFPHIINLPFPPPSSILYGYLPHCALDTDFLHQADRLSCCPSYFTWALTPHTSSSLCMDALLTRFGLQHSSGHHFERLLFSSKN